PGVVVAGGGPRRARGGSSQCAGVGAGQAGPPGAPRRRPQIAPVYGGPGPTPALAVGARGQDGGGAPAAGSARDPVLCGAAAPRTALSPVTQEGAARPRFSSVPGRPASPRAPRGRLLLTPPKGGRRRAGATLTMCRSVQEGATRRGARCAAGSASANDAA